MGCGSSKTKETDPPAGQAAATANQSAPAVNKAPQASTAQSTQVKPASTAATSAAAPTSSVSPTVATTQAEKSATAPSSTGANSTAQGAPTSTSPVTNAKETTVAKGAASSSATASEPKATAVPAATATVTAPVSQPQTGSLADPAPLTGSAKTAGTTTETTQALESTQPSQPLSRGQQLALQAEREQEQKAAQSQTVPTQDASAQQAAPLSRGAQLALLAEQNLETQTPQYETGQEVDAQVSIIVYSTYGHVLELARAEQRGVNSVPGVSAQIFQVPETLSPDILQKMHSPPKPWNDIPMADANSLPSADGFLLGTPTRFGNVSGQFKQFWDSTGSLWQKGALHGKPFGMFVATASQGGGQEETVRSALSNFVHHGMIFVPAGSNFGPELFDVEALHGGSAWGAGTFAGATGARQPSQLELKIAEHQGRGFGEVVRKLKQSQLPIPA